jgi:hypothetical protein
MTSSMGHVHVGSQMLILFITGNGYRDTATQEHPGEIPYLLALLHIKASYIPGWAEMRATTPYENHHPLIKTIQNQADHKVYIC